MVASIAIGQIVSRTGRYKAFIVAGFVIATLSILSLVTLQPDSPYWHEAVSMVFIGIGMGMAMPILNLAVQNEFEQKDLGAATSSVQLFRGLGSTVGTAFMSGILTAGIISAVGHPDDLAYIQTLKNRLPHQRFCRTTSPLIHSSSSIHRSKQFVMAQNRDSKNSDA
ncbi:MFS transporter [Candidatus Saccharibacteria bacterium]|nr:MAG: MFS transporter [Candidatus Saccharibacteria bacterium]